MPTEEPLDLNAMLDAVHNQASMALRNKIIHDLDWVVPLNCEYGTDATASDTQVGECQNPAQWLVVHPCTEVARRIPYVCTTHRNEALAITNPVRLVCGHTGRIRELIRYIDIETGK
ncbi:hypothetical protein [Glaciihabitans sp. dw_435]|uniref:hypothetical protein n=1 Tax=Glaciihabitans sp. dw_435 TaxID=2720081 RepID=UPI001BD62B89|nr:hypothetical protein [Glaciihabitans sp. dw_435]